MKLSVEVRLGEGSLTIHTHMNGIVQEQNDSNHTLSKYRSADSVVQEYNDSDHTLSSTGVLTV